MSAPAPESYKVVKAFAVPGIAFAVARVPGTPRAFVGTSNFKVLEFDLSAEKPEPRVVGAHDSYVTGLAVAGGVLVSGGYDGKLKWWDVESGKPVRSTDAHARQVRRVVASPDGRRVASVADDMACRVWDARTGEKLLELRGHDAVTPHGFGSMLHAVAFSADGKLLATADKVGRVVVWDAETGRQAGVVTASELYTWDPVQRRHSIGGVRGVAFAPDGGLLAVGGMGQAGNIDGLTGMARIELYDWQSGKQVAAFPSDRSKGIYNRLTFHPSGDWLLAAGGGNRDGFVTFFDVRNKKPLHQESVPMHAHDVELDADGRGLFAVGHEKACVMRA